MGSKFVAEIRDQVEYWEKKLAYVSDVIDEWLSSKSHGCTSRISSMLKISSNNFQTKQRCSSKSISSGEIT